MTNLLYSLSFHHLPFQNPFFFIFFMLCSVNLFDLDNLYTIHLLFLRSVLIFHCRCSRLTCENSKWLVWIYNSSFSLFFTNFIRFYNWSFLCYCFQMRVWLFISLKCSSVYFIVRNQEFEWQLDLCKVPNQVPVDHSILFPKFINVSLLLNFHVVNIDAKNRFKLISQTHGMQ